MSKVKLNPYVDLGLGTDPNIQPSTQGTTMTSDPYSTPSQNPMDTSTANSAQVADTMSSPNMGNISDINSFTSQSSVPSEPMPASPIQDNSMTMSSMTMTPTPSPVVETDSSSISVQSTSGESGGGMNRILMILAIVLFLASLGGLVYFALKYFNLI